MRIAFAHYSAADDISGVSTWLVELAGFLKREGHDVAVLVQDLCQPGDPRPLEDRLERDGVDLHRSSASGSLKRDVAATLAFLNQWQPDVFLPQCKSPHFVAAAIAGRAGLPWAFTLHSDDPDYWAIAESLPPSRHGGQIVCVSQHIQAKLRGLQADQASTVIPCGVAIPAERTHFNGQPFHVVFSGRLWEHQKRASLVVRSLIRACERGGTAIRATLIGDGYSRNACEGLVREAQLTDRIRFTGLLPVDGVRTILQDSQAILLMSDFEGLPVALLEAMAAGVVPVVRSIPSGIPEVVIQGQTGLLVSEDPEDAAAALLRLAADPRLWQRCSEAARRLVEQRFNRGRCHSLWLELLSEMAESSKPSYPIRGRHGVSLRRLSPLMLAPYRQARNLWTLRVKSAWASKSARLKAAIKQRLHS